MQNALKKYLDGAGQKEYAHRVIVAAKSTGLTDNSIRSIARYSPEDIERMRHGSYRKLLVMGIDMDNWED
jgi:hypothetical protein